MWSRHDKAPNECIIMATRRLGASAEAKVVASRNDLGGWKRMSEAFGDNQPLKYCVAALVDTAVDGQRRRKIARSNP